MVQQDIIKNGLSDDKPFNTGSLREVTDLYESGEISYGKMVDLVNEIAIKWHNKQKNKNIKK